MGFDAILFPHYTLYQAIHYFESVLNVMCLTNLIQFNPFLLEQNHKKQVLYL